MSTVTPGYTFGASEKATNTKLNLLGNPQVTPSAGEITHEMVSGAGFARDNLVYVDATNGSDSTGTRERVHLPFQTLVSAKTAASSGDTIIVYPGTYDEKDLSKDGVDWLFMPGAVVTYTGSSDGGIFDDSSTGANAAASFNVRGWGSFNRNGSGSSASCVLIQNSSSTVTIEGTFSSSVEHGVDIDAGTVNIFGDCNASGSSGSKALAADSVSANVFARNVKFTSTGSSQQGIELTEAAVATLENCEISSGASAVWDINTNIAVTVTVVGSLKLSLKLPTSVTINGGVVINLDSVRIHGAFGGDSLTTFADVDATPDVSGAFYCESGTATETITDFDGSTIFRGQKITVVSKAAITYDVTSSGLKGGSTDIVTASGDITKWEYDGTDWYLSGLLLAGINYNTYA